jgi:hypothetical protein
MRCIFCKCDSISSKTIEHILPEALGNKDHVLLPKIVCDTCNNYFGRKVEGPLLNSIYFREARSRNFILNKEDRLTTVHGLLLPGFIPIEMVDDFDGHAIYASRENEAQKLQWVLNHYRKVEFIVPMSEKPDERLMSRFLAKTALEVLASRLQGIPEGLDEVIDKPELDELRQYARYDKPKVFWTFNERRIYPEGALFQENSQKYEVLHEYCLLCTESYELYLILAILGIEYAINLGGPEIDGYLDWLKGHDYKSPLYVNSKLGWEDN